MKISLTTNLKTVIKGQIVNVQGHPLKFEHCQLITGNPSIGHISVVPRGVIAGVRYIKPAMYVSVLWLYTFFSEPSI